MAARAIWEPGPEPRYDAVAIVLHWTIAALILFNLATGFFHENLPHAIIPIHVSSGITILALSVVRVIWRLTHRPPPFAVGVKAWERGLARAVYFGFYLAMLLVPFSGWAMISASPPPGSAGAAYAAAMRQQHPSGDDHEAHMGPPQRQMIWWTIPLPLIGPLQDIGRTPQGAAAQREKHEQIETVHALGAYAMLFLLILHVAGALKHQYYDRERELARMGIG